MDPTEHNEIENKELKEHLGNAALQMLAEGTGSQDTRRHLLPVRLSVPH